MMHSSMKSCIVWIKIDEGGEVRCVKAKEVGQVWLNVVLWNQAPLLSWDNIVIWILTIIIGMRSFSMISNSAGLYLNPVDQFFAIRITL